MPIGRRRTGLSATACALGALVTASVAIATPPCAAFDYRVAFQDPVCSAVLLRDSGRPLANLFLREWPSGDYVSFADLVRPAPSEAERWTFLDANSDGTASANDAFQHWTPGSCGTDLIVYMGANATSVGGSQGLTFREGWVLDCMGSRTDPNLPLLVVGGGTAGLNAVGIAVAWLLSRRDT